MLTFTETIVARDLGESNDLARIRLDFAGRFHGLLTDWEAHVDAEAGTWETESADE